MHNAQLKTSGRLQRVLAVLQDGQPKTTRQIIREGRCCAVNSIVSELRRNGIKIECKAVKKGVFQYRLIAYRRDTEHRVPTNKNGKNYVDK